MWPKLLQILRLTVMAVVGLLVIAGMIYDRARKRRVASHLASRAPLDSKTFAVTYFADSPAKADVAARLRDVLAANLAISLDGLHPDDRLDEDLHAELLANPDLFWDIDRELGVTTPTTSFEAYRQSLVKLRTFRDLVEYVTSRRAVASETQVDKNCNV